MEAQIPFPDLVRRPGSLNAQIPFKATTQPHGNAPGSRSRLIRLRRSKGGLLTASLALAFWATAAHNAWAETSIRLHTEPRLVEILEYNRTLLNYPFSTNQFKPYVGDLFTLDGRELLRDSPPDHVHHHGLMYGIQVNDINFWEEAPDAGHQIPQAELTREVKKDAAGRPRARFSQVLHWVKARDAGERNTTPMALLVETRTITLTVDSETGGLLLEWTSEFTVGEGASEVILTGTSYDGLGIRFRADWDGVADRRNSENLPYPDDGVQGVLAARWMAVDHPVEGRPFTITLFNHPSNPGRARFFSMQKPFTYLSATQGLDEAPLTYRNGDHWRLRYLLMVSPGRTPRNLLDGQYESFSQP